MINGVRDANLCTSAHSASRKHYYELIQVKQSMSSQNGKSTLPLCPSANWCRSTGLDRGHVTLAQILKRLAAAWKLAHFLASYLLLLPSHSIVSSCSPIIGCDDMDDSSLSVMSQA